MYVYMFVILKYNVNIYICMFLLFFVKEIIIVIVKMIEIFFIFLKIR